LRRATGTQRVSSERRSPSIARVALVVLVLLGLEAATVSISNPNETATTAALNPALDGTVAQDGPITSTTYQETSPAIVYRGTWSSAAHPDYRGGEVRWSTERGASATFRFTGIGVSWIGPTGPTRGKAKVYVDGRLVKTVDANTARFDASSVLYSANFTSERERTLKIVVAGTTGHPMVAIDTLVVRNATTTVAPAPETSPAPGDEVGGPTIELSPSAGPAGSSVTVSGAGFPAHALVELTWDGAGDDMPTAAVNRRGEFMAMITVPSASDGPHTLAAAAVPKNLNSAKLAAVAGATAATIFTLMSAPVVTPPVDDPIPATPTPTATPIETPAPTPTATPVAPPVGDYPADTTLRYVATSSLARPGYLAPVTDPTWGTTITRISNTAGVRQVYSRTPAWNSDESKILLSFSYPGRMLDGSTYADLGSFNHVPQAIWANTDPNALYGVSGNQFIRQNATTEGRTTLRTFSAYSSISIGDYEGAIDDNDTYVALIGTTSGGSRHLITYNIATDAIVADIAAPANMDNAQISRKGNYVVVVGSGYTRRYDRNLTGFITLYPYGHHGDNALDASGNEIFVANATDNGVESFRLSTGASTVLLPTRTAFDAGHTSGRNINRPGWIYLSNYDPSIYGFNYLWPGRDQVVALKTDGSGTVEVFGFAHHSILAYANEPQAVPSRDGRRVLFASEWGTSGAYAYVASH
jgi:hypothetical protein